MRPPRGRPVGLLLTSSTARDTRKFIDNGQTTGFCDGAHSTTHYHLSHAQALMDASQTTGFCERMHSTTICCSCMRVYCGKISMECLFVVPAHVHNTQIYHDSVVTTTGTNHYDDDVDYPFHHIPSNVARMVLHVEEKLRAINFFVSSLSGGGGGEGAGFSSWDFNFSSAENFHRQLSIKAG